MHTASLRAEPRSERGKGAARQLRRTGRVPAVLYGHGEDPRELSVDGHELEKLLAHISVENTLIDLSIGGAETTQALIREVQTHPFRPEVLHLDLFHVHAGEKLRLQVPVRLAGSAAGVRNGGVLDQVLYDLEVECLPRDIPDAAEVDVSGLEIGDAVRVRDVSLPRVKILNDPDLPVVSVLQPTVAALPETPETEPGAGGTVEPELIRDRAAAVKDVPETE
jgi:large subunit ribosomal protein L25